MIIKGTFTSIWDGGTEICTFATLDSETGEICAESVDGDNVDSLDEEYFTDEDENQYEVCSECHEYIMKTVMVDGIGHCLEEKTVCSNSDCSSKY